MTESRQRQQRAWGLSWALGESQSCGFPPPPAFLFLSRIPDFLPECLAWGWSALVATSHLPQCSGTGNSFLGGCQSIQQLDDLGFGFWAKVRGRTLPSAVSPEELLIFGKL